MSEVRFWNNVSTIETEKGCLEWKLSCNEDGYGIAWFEGRKNRSHRLAFELFHKRKITEGMCILHTCDTPKCCRPSHLIEGTHQDNMNDKSLKNRQARLQGETNGRSKLIEAQVLEIREKYKKGTNTQKAIAKEYNTVQSIISSIIRRQIWTHV